MPAWHTPQTRVDRSLPSGKNHLSRLLLVYLTGNPRVLHFASRDGNPFEWKGYTPSEYFHPSPRLRTGGRPRSPYRQVLHVRLYRQIYRVHPSVSYRFHAAPPIW